MEFIVLTILALETCNIFSLLILRGLKAILPTVIAEPKIAELKLARNSLTDEGIVHLCYELEKAYHMELTALDLSGNQIGKTGADTLYAFIQKMPNIATVRLEEND